MFLIVTFIRNFLGCIELINIITCHTFSIFCMPDKFGLNVTVYAVLHCRY